MSTISSQIEKEKQTIRRNSRKGLDTSASREKIKMLKLTKKDITNCRDRGYTGKPLTTNTPNNDNSPLPPVETPPAPQIPIPSNACSIVGGQAQFSFHIIGGSKCLIGNTPVVYLDIEDSRGNSVGACTGTVVRKAGESSSKTVVFAAHCIEGASRITINTPNGRMTSISAQSHPRWNSNRDITEADVAVASFSENIPTRSVQLLTTPNLNVGENAIIAGYGVDENGNADASTLKAGNVIIGDVSSYGISTFYDGSGANTCFGDSGGPIFVNRNNEWLLAGVTSNGESENCGVGDRSNYANLVDPNVKDWVYGLLR